MREAPRAPIAVILLCSSKTIRLLKKTTKSILFDMFQDLENQTRKRQ